MCIYVPTGVNFTNIIQAAFTHADPEQAKKTDNLTVFFMLLGSLGIKALLKTLMKKTPGVRDGVVYDNVWNPE